MSKILYKLASIFRLFYWTKVTKFVKVKILSDKVVVFWLH